jgi:uncharacterized membrane protein YeaQ/YmgE (transglycosylase-associated protein family)
MSLTWIIIAGLIPSAVAKLLMRGHKAGGLFILGISGAIIAALMQYSEQQPIGFIAPFVGAVMMLAVYAVTARRPPAEEARYDEFRRAA